MKKLLSTLVLFVFITIASSTSLAQQSSTGIITTTMAYKLSLFCQYQKTAYALCSSMLYSNGIYSRVEQDKIIRYLEKHLDYAEAFIIDIYSRYGVEMTYFALKDWFTIPEIDKAEQIWSIEQKRREKIEQKRKIEEEAKQKIIEKEQEAKRKIIEKEQKAKQKILEEKQKRYEDSLRLLIVQGKIFDYDDARIIKPIVKIDFKKISSILRVKDTSDIIRYNYNVVINNQGGITLEDTCDTLLMSRPQKDVLGQIIKESYTEEGKILLGKDELKVNTRYRITISEEQVKRYGISIELNKRKRIWEISDIKKINKTLSKEIYRANYPEDEKLSYYHRRIKDINNQSANVLKDCCISLDEYLKTNDFGKRKNIILDTKIIESIYRLSTSFGGDIVLDAPLKFTFKENESEKNNYLKKELKAKDLWSY